MKTREQIHNELDQCIRDKIAELHSIDGLRVKEINLHMARYAYINNGRDQTIYEGLSIVYE